MRLIDADELIDVIKSYHGDMLIDDIIDVISEQPAVNDWILCSEKLPQETRLCEVTAYDGHIYLTTQVRWNQKLKSWILYGVMKNWKLIAWKPITEPYNPERSNT